MIKSLRDARKTYDKTINASGDQSFDCGDKTALILRGRSVDEVLMATDDVTGRDPGYHALKYGHLNRGLQRMICGNILRQYGS